MANEKKLLEGLSAPGVTVSVRSLAKYIASSGVLVTPHAGRCRGTITLDASTYGVNINAFSEEGAGFYVDRVRNGNMRFIPREDDKELNRLEGQMRYQVDLASLNDGFIPITAYERLKENFDEIRRQYFKKRDEIVNKWDEIVENFRSGLVEMLKGLNLEDSERTRLLEGFMSEIPDPTAYADSFHMTLYVRAFPAETNSEGLSESISTDVQMTWRDDVISTAILSIEKTIGEGWSKAMIAAKQYSQKGSIQQRTIMALEKFGQDLSWKNVFKNKLLEQVQEQINSLSSKDANGQAQLIEDIILNIYSYAKETQLNLDMQISLYTTKQMDDMLLLCA